MKDFWPKRHLWSALQDGYECREGCSGGGTAESKDSLGSEHVVENRLLWLLLLRE